jgi:acetyl esterase/lipase
MSTTANVVLEPSAQAFAEATSKPPFLADLGPDEGRRTVDDAQSGAVEMPAADVSALVIPGGPTGSVPVRIVRPAGVRDKLPVVVYTHGAGWVFGNFETHERLVRELAVGVGAAVVFPEYTRSPEARYPVALQQCFHVVEWIHEYGYEVHLDRNKIAVSGDSVGGNMTIAITLMAKAAEGPELAAQALFYPVTDASFDTPSYLEFAEGYFLRRDGMQWFWDQYAPDLADRDEITASPLRATPEQLAGLPPALVITAEADVLRDEGEAYARHLRAAGIDVTATRYEGVIHDFVMLNALRDTKAAEAAIAQAVDFLKRALAR